MLGVGGSQPQLRQLLSRSTIIYNHRCLHSAQETKGTGVSVQDENAFNGRKDCQQVRGKLLVNAVHEERFKYGTHICAFSKRREAIRNKSNELNLASVL
jgi:hypothetical protein